MYENKRAEIMGMLMMCGGGIIVAGSILTLALAAMEGRMQGGAAILQLILCVLTVVSHGMFAVCAFLGTIEKTAKLYSKACYVFAANLGAQFLLYALLFFESEGMLTLVYLVAAMLVSMIGAGFMLMLGSDARYQFSELRRDRLVCAAFSAAGVALAVLMILSKAAAMSPFGTGMTAMAVVMHIGQFVVLAIYPFVGKKVRDPYTAEELAELKATKVQERQAKKDAIEAKKKAEADAKAAEEEALRKKEERRQKLIEERKAAAAEAKRKEEEEKQRQAEATKAAQAEAIRKLEEARRAADEKRRAEEEAKRLAEEEAKRKAEAEAAARKAAEEAKIAENKRVAKALARKEAERVVQTYFHCDMEAWQRINEGRFQR